MEKSKLLNVSLTYKTNTKKQPRNRLFFCIIKYIGGERMIIEKVDINRKIVATSCLKNSYKNFTQLFLQGKPLTYRAFFDIIAQNKYFVQFRGAKRLKY